MKLLWASIGIWWQLAVVGAIAAAVVGAGWRVHHNIWQGGYDQRDQEVQVAVAAANAESRRIEQRRQSIVIEATNAQAKRETTLRSQAAGARTERDGLRDDLAAAQRDLPSASCEAVRKRADALSSVFDQCAERYTGLAEKAGRHASDALTLDQAWPTDAGPTNSPQPPAVPAPSQGASP